MASNSLFVSAASCMQSMCGACFASAMKRLMALHTPGAPPVLMLRTVAWSIIAMPTFGRGWPPRKSGGSSSSCWGSSVEGVLCCLLWPLLGLVVWLLFCCEPSVGPGFGSMPSSTKRLNLALAWASVRPHACSRSCRLCGECCSHILCEVWFHFWYFLQGCCQAAYASTQRQWEHV